jgi:hypothetical protein
MRVEKCSDGRFVVVRGDVNAPQYFSFYVDADRSSWSKYLSQAHKNVTLTGADETMAEIRRRTQIRRNANRGRKTEVNLCND